ncbi:MAG: double-strand break repair protein AddB, partial [Pseudomonadota bacterium]
QFHDQGLALDALDALAPDDPALSEAAGHWQQTLEFVDIVRTAWPLIRAEHEGGALDPRERLTMLIRQHCAGWTEAPPMDPVIVAGSTGSVRSTAMLMQTVAALPTGAVVLPGFDRDLSADIWERADADHPMGPFRRWMAPIGLSPADIGSWQPVASDRGRIELITQALRPAPVTDAWHRDAAGLAGTMHASTRTLTLIEADSPRSEAEAIAVAIRETIEEPGTTVALVTPDAALGRRVTAALAQFGIEPDDTAGRPLALTPPGIFMMLLARFCSPDADAVTLAALLQHPLMAPGISRRDHLLMARQYERLVLRAGPVHVAPGVLPPWPTPRRSGDDSQSPGLEVWRDAVNARLTPLRAHLGRAACLQRWLANHRSVAEDLSTAEPGGQTGSALWNNEAGAALRSYFTRLQAAADALGDTLVTDYPDLLTALFEGETLRPAPRRPHPRVAIRGPREARLETADVTILGGLNDGTWPEMPDPGPWISRPMHSALGLPPPERTVGLSAHDFYQAVCRRRVFLTRARKIDGAPTVASRWLTRLETLIVGIGTADAWDAMRARGDRYGDLAKRTSRPSFCTPRAIRPAPRPPAAALPARLSVTEVETLVRDPYAIYARHVLHLRPLEPVGRAPDARERGNAVHAVMERFQKRLETWPGEDLARRQLIETAEEVLAGTVPWADLSRAWRARIVRFADWFVRHEAERRTLGQPIAAETYGDLSLDLTGGVFGIRAKADRIDLRHDGKGAIYDYKTGSPPSRKEIESGFNQQLHLQAAMMAAGAFDGVDPLVAEHGAYIGLTGAGEGGKETCIDALGNAASEHLSRFISLIEAYRGGAPMTSRGRMRFSRDQGDYDHLARFGEWGGDDDAEQTG